MSSPSRAVLGIDVGGTATRAVVAGPDGTVHGRAAGAGANRWSSAGPGAATIRGVAAQALREAGAPSIAAAVVGLAGWGEQAAISSALADLLGPGPEVLAVPDVVVNHAAGSPLDHGVVLVAGTGAIAAWVADDRILRRADGCGWLLGDEGSAVWLGLEGLRAALRALDGRGPDTELVAPLAEQLVPDVPADGAAEDHRARLVEAGLVASPVAFGRLAPTVVAVAETGDAVAAGIVRAAAGHLATTLRTVAAGHATERVVLAGSLLLGAGSLRREVVAAIGRDHPAATIVSGHDGATGAAAIALRRAARRPLTAAVHTRLCAPGELTG